MEGEALVTKLKSSGIPREALSTTLAAQKYPELRSYIENKDYSETPILVIAKCNPLAFYLSAKEMALSGFSVFCGELVDIHTAMFAERDDIDKLRNTIKEASVIAISGFYEDTGSVAPFFSPYESAYFRSWFMRRVNNGTKFILLTDKSIVDCESWWSGRLVKFIMSHCLQYTGKAK